MLTLQQMLEVAHEKAVSQVKKYRKLRETHSLSQRGLNYWEGMAQAYKNAIDLCQIAERKAQLSTKNPPEIL